MNIIKWFVIFWACVIAAISLFWTWPIFLLIAGAFLIFLPFYIAFKIVHWFASFIAWVITRPFRSN